MFRDDSDQRHPATPARLQAAREDGDVAISRQLSGAIQLLGVLIVASLFVGQIAASLRTLTQTVWVTASIDSADVDAGQLTWQSIKTVGLAVLPLMGLMLAVSLFSHIVQTGPMFLPKKVTLDPTRLSPSHWLERVFSIPHAMSALMDLPRLLIVVGAAGLAGYWNWQFIVTLGSSSVGEFATQSFGLILKIGFQTAIILFLFGLVDYGFRWTARRKRLRMSDHQLREELRMQSSNSQTIDQRRRLHRELSQR
jgi:flagellar biosynthetic protein FlhB